MSNTTYMVTGAAGYIGEELVHQIISRGYSVIQLDRDFDTPIIPENLDHSVDCVIHLAALSGIEACQKDSKQAIQDNIIATNHVVNFCSLNDIPLVFASSAAADNPKSSIYAFSKAVGESYIKSQLDTFTILRFCNVYGGKNYLEKKSSVISKFLSDSYNGIPLHINGDGSQTRDFIRIDRICDAILEVAQMHADGYDTYSGQTFSVGTGIQTSILELAQTISKDNNYVFDSSRSVGVESSIPDKLLPMNWDCSKDLYEYLSTMIRRDK